MAALSGAETTVAGRWLYGKLAAITGSTGAYPGVARRGAILPYIVYQSFPRPGEGDVEALGSGRILARLRFQIKVLTASLAAAEPIVKAIDAAISGQTAQQSGYTIGNVRRIEPLEMPVVEGEETYWQVGGYYDIDVFAGV